MYRLPIQNGRLFTVGQNATLDRETLENGLHWALDVTFREDDSRVRDRTAARNLAILRKVAINLMGRDRATRISMRAPSQAGRLE